MTKPKAINCIPQLVAFVLLIIKRREVEILKELEELEKAEAKLAKTEQELHYNEDRVKILEHMIPKLTRKERTHRLCVHGGMLDKFLKEPDLMTDDQVMDILLNAFSSNLVQKKIDFFIRQRKEEILENH